MNKIQTSSESMLAAFEESGFNGKAAAKKLGLSTSTFFRRAKEYNLPLKGHASREDLTDRVFGEWKVVVRVGIDPKSRATLKLGILLRASLREKNCTSRFLPSLTT